MKELLPILLFFLPIYSLCQIKPDSASINSIVRNIDRLSKSADSTYSKTKIVNHKKVNELWVYFNDTRFSKLSINYTIDSTAYTEKYYFNNDLLIYAYEREVFFSPLEGIDQGTVWAGDFYFSNGKLIDYVTLGHGKSESDDWDPEKEILERLKKRKAELILLK